MAVTKTTKINMYKMVSIQGMRTKNNPSASALVKNVQAINNIGKTLNSVSLVLKDIKKIELERLDAEKKRRIKESFVPRYGRTTGMGASKFINDFVAKPPPSFWGSLLKIFSGLLKLFVIRPILEWLSNPENKKKVERGLQVLFGALKFLYNLSKSIVGTTINGLYDLLRDDAKWYERLGGLGKVFLALGGLFLGMRWLKNPLRLIKDVRGVLTGFRNGLLRSQNQLRKARGMKPIPGTKVSGKNFKAPKTKFRGKGWAGLVFISGLGLVNILSGEQVEAEQPPEMAKGGWISGPQSGYPVSTAGNGRGAPDFIGHGTEYVATKPTGESFVIPFDTPATRVAPSITAANLQTASMLGFKTPTAPPRIGTKQNFLGGLFKGIGNIATGKTWGGGNRGTGRDGTFGLGTSGQGRPSDGQPAPGSQKKNWFSGLGKGLLAAAPDIGQLIGGDKGSRIGSIVQGFGSQMSSGNKMGFQDVLGAVLPIASEFMSPKMSNIIGNVVGIGNMFLGPNAGDYSLGDKIGGVLGAFGMGDSPFGQIVGKVAGAFSGDGLMSQFASTGGGFGSGSGGGGAAAAAGITAESRTDTDNEKEYAKGNPAVTGGGIGAAIRGGQWALSKGFTVSEHPNFRKNKWNKMTANTGKGYVPGGGQKVGKHSKGSLHYRGLALDVTDWRKGDWKSRTASLAGEAYGQRKSLNLTQIIQDGWGAWFGGKKRGPGSYGHPSHLHLGFADEKQAGGTSGGLGLSGSDMSLLQKYVASEAKGSSPLEAALVARTGLNMAGLYGQGVNPSNFGASGASSFFDILDAQTDKNIWSMPFDAPAMKFSMDAIGLGMNYDKMKDMLGENGLPDPFSNFLLNSTSTEKGKKDLGAGAMPFGDFSFKTEGNNFYDKLVKNQGSDFNIFAKDQGAGSDGFGFGGFDTSKYTGASNGEATSYGSTTGITKPGGAVRLFGGKSGKDDRDEISGGPNSNKEQGRNAYMFQKVTRQREYARNQIMQKHSAMIQQTIAQVQAHNAAVRASVAEAQAAVSKIMGSQAAAMGSISGLGGAVQRTAAILTSTQSTQAFLA